MQFLPLIILFSYFLVNNLHFKFKLHLHSSLLIHKFFPQFEDAVLRLPNEVVVPLLVLRQLRFQFGYLPIVDLFHHLLLLLQFKILIRNLILEILDLTIRFVK
jgi:hypothetical protein